MDEIPLIYDDTSEFFYRQIFEDYLLNSRTFVFLLNEMTRDKYIKSWEWPMGGIKIFGNNGTTTEINLFKAY